MQPIPPSTVITFDDVTLAEREDLFLFPGSDQVLLSFKLDVDESGALTFVQTSKLGVEQQRFPLGAGDCVISDYSGTIENLFNFDVRVRKRVEISERSLSRIRSETTGEEEEYRIDRVRSVG